MRQVYDFAITPDGAGLPGANGASVIFRFMPDAKEVHSALEVCDLQDIACQHLLPFSQHVGGFRQTV